MSILVLLLSIFAFASTEIIPNEQDVCLMKPFEGYVDEFSDGELVYSSWTYMPNLNECAEFTHNVNTNGNNFYSKADCEKICKKTDPCQQQPYSEDIIRYQMQIWTWTYVAETNKCERYEGGHNGNDNRFDSKEDCENTCKKVHPCLQKPYSDGNGLFVLRMSIKAWTFIPEENRCEMYQYGGFGGNDNRFETPEECENQCVQNVCKEKPYSGSIDDGENMSCNLDLPVWTYLSETNKCVEYSYGGCFANGNFFITLEECNKQCVA